MLMHMVMTVCLVLVFCLAAGAKEGAQVQPQRLSPTLSDHSGKQKPGFFKSLFSGKLFKKSKKTQELVSKPKGWAAIVSQSQIEQMGKGQVKKHKKSDGQVQEQRKNPQTQKSKPQKQKVKKSKPSKSGSEAASWPWGGVSPH